MKLLPLRVKITAAPGLKNSEELLEIRKSIIKMVFLIAIFLGSLAYFTNIFSLIQSQSWIVAGVQTFVYSSLIFLTLFDKLSLQTRTFGLLFIVLTLAVAEMLETGLVGEGRIFMATFALLSMILLDFRQALAMIGLSIVIIAIIAGLMVSGVLPPPDITKIDDSTRAAEWLTGTAIYLLVTGLISAALVSLTRGMQQAMARQTSLALDLEKERSVLENRVQERTNALQQRAAMMQIIADFSQDIQGLYKQDDMLALLVSTFRQKLAVSNIGVFLPGEDGRNYNLKSNEGDLVQSIKEKHGVIWTMEPGSLALLFEKGETQLLRNAGESSIYFHQPGFSDLHAIILLPLRSTGKAAGAIGLFYTNEPDIEEGHLQLYRSLVDQTAIALEKAALLSSLQKNVDELKISGREATRKNWRGYIKSSRQALSMHYNQEKVEPGGSQSQSATLAFNERRVIVSKNEDHSSSTVAIPIMLRDEPFGVIDVRFKGEHVPENLISLIEAATKRLALALENARLMDQMQNRADREVAISALAARIRASSDINGILKVAAAEIGNSFGASEVLVQLRTPDGDSHKIAENS